MNNKPEILIESLKIWILKLVEGAPTNMQISTKRVNNMLYTRRAIKLREFVDLCKGKDFADAIFGITGVCLGSASRVQKETKAMGGGKGGEARSGYHLLKQEDPTG